MPDLLKPSQELASPELATEYARWFVNRRAYTRQSETAHRASGRHCYYRPKNNGAEVHLTSRDIERHLEGHITLGLYAINPRTQRVKWMAIDADYRRALEDLLRLQYELGQSGIQAALEQSRRGGHLWIFFESPVPANKARIFVRHIAGKLSVELKGSGKTDGLELFPGRIASKLASSAAPSADRSVCIAPPASGTGFTALPTIFQRRWNTCARCEE